MFFRGLLAGLTEHAGLFAVRSGRLGVFIRLVWIIKRAPVALAAAAERVRVWDCDRSVLWPLQPKDHLETLQEHSVASTAVEITSGSVTGAFCGPCSRNNQWRRAAPAAAAAAATSAIVTGSLLPQH